MIHVNHIFGGYGENSVLRNISLSVKQGQFTGIIGPNGSGKTTLMKILSGAIKPSKGTVNIKDRTLESYSSKELARLIAVLPQHTENSFDFTVREVVSLGRYPYYKGWLKQSDLYDEEMIDNAMKLTHVFHFSSKRIRDLSGGERQRVFLAKALAQDPEILLLDEPTNHLDLSNQMKLLELLRKWTRSRHLTVVAILHDLNLASLYCDNIYLLENGELRSKGVPNDVMHTDTLQNVFDSNLTVQEHSKVPRPLISLNPHEEEMSETEKGLKIINKENLLVVSSANSLKTLSSIHGFKWTDSFIIEHLKEEFSYQREDQSHSVRYSLKANLDHAIIINRTESFGGISIVAIAEPSSYADINLFVFLEADLTEEAFVQAMLMITKAKYTSILLRETAIEKISSCSGVCSIAATQNGKKISSVSQVDKAGIVIFDMVREAIEKVRAVTSEWKCTPI